MAKIIMGQKDITIANRVSEFVTGEINTEDEALQGARDIIAEWVNENKRARNSIRTLFSRSAIMHSKPVRGKKEEADKYKDYFEFSEPLNKMPSHRVLAILRGEHEGLLNIHIQPDEEKAIETLGT
ncbi:MAG: RNA-binding transcriptional accessory protein, partial [Bacteroidales bacterium]|nr:RNA-binding transcriptional accessory protein [Bacteroidales bacterium]